MKKNNAIIYLAIGTILIFLIGPRFDLFSISSLENEQFRFVGHEQEHNQEETINIRSEQGITSASFDFIFSGDYLITEEGPYVKDYPYYTYGSWRGECSDCRYESGRDAQSLCCCKAIGYEDMGLLYSGLTCFNKEFILPKNIDIKLAGQTILTIEGNSEDKIYTTGDVSGIFNNYCDEQFSKSREPLGTYNIVETDCEISLTATASNADVCDGFGSDSCDFSISVTSHVTGGNSCLQEWVCDDWDLKGCDTSTSLIRTCRDVNQCFNSPKSNILVQHKDCEIVTATTTTTTTLQEDETTSTTILGQTTTTTPINGVTTTTTTLQEDEDGGLSKIGIIILITIVSIFLILIFKRK